MSKTRGFESIKGYTAVLPKRKTKGSAGYDISVPQRTVLPAGKLTVEGIFCKYLLADDDNTTDTRNGGIGSTGK